MNLEWLWLIPIGIGGYSIWSTAIRGVIQLRKEKNDKR